MQTIRLFDPQSTISAGDELRRLINDPQGAFQRWKRHEAPFTEMCRAVVLALAGELDQLDQDRSDLD